MDKPFILASLDAAALADSAQHPVVGSVRPIARSHLITGFMAAVAERALAVSH